MISAISMKVPNLKIYFFLMALRRWQPFAAFLLVVSPQVSVAAEGGSWQQNWDACRDFRGLTFQWNGSEIKELYQQGMLWEKKVSKEISEISDVAQTTCKAWAENPNGDVPLKEFIRRFTEISKSALLLKQEATEKLSPGLTSWWKNESSGLAIFGFKFESYRCGRAVINTQKSVKADLLRIEQKFDALKNQCPAAADELIAKAKVTGPNSEKFGYGNGGPARTPSGTSEKGHSDITGTKPPPPREPKP